MRLFSDEKIEMADPRKVPFWQGFLRELYTMLGTLAAGLMLGIVYVIATGIMLGVLANMYPQFTFEALKAGFCGH